VAGWLPSASSPGLILLRRFSEITRYIGSAISPAKGPNQPDEEDAGLKWIILSIGFIQIFATHGGSLPCGRA
jgi:hypothetical protein